MKWIAGGLVAVALVGAEAGAHERRLTYTYESGTLPAGQRELELWTTWRGGRSDYYSRFDYRAEIEWGLSDRLMSSLYLNWKQVSEQDPADPQGKLNTGEFQGVSSEWKYKVWDPVADLFGLALYQEYTIASDEFEWENRVIVDKRIGPFLASYNLVLEPEWEFGPSAANYAIQYENTLGLIGFVSHRVSVGAEARNVNKSTKDSSGFESSALYVGPVATYAADTWYITATALTQLPALKRSEITPQDRWVMDDLEKVNIRILASMKF